MKHPSTIHDQMGRAIQLTTPPNRIISLVPSQTELLLDLGLAHAVVGRTKFCVHPKPTVQNIPKIGGTKKLKLDQIRALQPDLIIGNKEENTKEELELLMQEFPVWMSDIADLSAALEMIRQLGEITHTSAKAEALADQIQANFASLRPYQAHPIDCAYFIWRKPYMVAASDTFINHLLAQAGFRNVFGHLTRYPAITASQLAAAAPPYLLLSSEPFPFKDKHIQELQAICPQSVIRLVDGELFSWYGSRLLHAPAYFSNLRKALAL
ncbi:MAG: helical backbone metal receptor [Bacteroidota bacterium]